MCKLFLRTRSCLWVTKGRCTHCLTCVQADTVIITNQNQRSEDPNQIVQDIISGFPEDILEYNSKQPWPGGVLQDFNRAEYTLREFVFDGQNR